MSIQDLEVTEFFPTLFRMIILKITWTKKRQRGATFKVIALYFQPRKIEYDIAI